MAAQSEAPSGETAKASDASAASVPTFDAQLKAVAEAGSARAEPAPPAMPAPAPASAGPSAAAPAAAQIAHPLVTGVPVSAVPVEVGLKSLAGVNRFDIRLDPEDLGQIDVRLDITSEGVVRAHIVVERPEALLSLQREASQLERALEQAGFKTQDEGVSMSLRQHGQGEAGGRRGEGGDGRQPAPSWQRQDDAAPTQQLRPYAWRRSTGVDRHI